MHKLCQATTANINMKREGKKKGLDKCASAEYRVLLWNASFHVSVHPRKNSDMASFSYI